VVLDTVIMKVVRFLMVELNYTASNLRFDIYVVFTTNYFFSGRWRSYQ
jgi:hypothetical protein